MSLPEHLAGSVGDEDVVARVALGGDDVLVVTPTRTLVYRADGLLSDETVEEYSHDVERIDVSEGRRKSKLVLSYGLDGEETVAIPSKRLDEVLHPVLAGVLAASDITDPGESVLRTFRFSELTLVITSHRVVKHIGSAVWDGEFEEFPYDDLTGLDFEEGTVATSVVLALGDRSERLKAPNESAREVRETLADAVCEYYDVGSLEEFRLTVQEGEDAHAETNGTTDFGDGPDPLSASPVADAEADAGSDGVADPPADGTASDQGAGGNADDTRAGSEASGEGMTVAETASGSDDPSDSLACSPTDDAATTPETGAADPDGIGEIGEVDAAGDDAFDELPFESAGVEDDALAAEVAALRATVEEQSARLDRQSELIERLIEELRRGR